MADNISSLLPAVTILEQPHYDALNLQSSHLEPKDAFAFAMPPRVSRSSGTTGSPAVSRSSPSTSSVRTMRKRADEIRTPIPAKHSISYGSPLTQMPNRNLVDRETKINSYAASVFQQVRQEKGSTDSRLRNEAQNANASVDAAGGSQREPSPDDEIELLQSPSEESDEAAEEEVDQDEDESEEEEEEQEEEEEGDDNDQEMGDGVEASLEVVKRQAEEEAARKEISTRAARKRRRDEEAEAEADRERIEREAKRRQEQSARAQRRAAQRHAEAEDADLARTQQPSSATLATPLGTENFRRSQSVPLSARSWIEEGSVYRQASIQSSSPQAAPAAAAANRAGVDSSRPLAPGPHLRSNLRSGPLWSGSGGASAALHQALNPTQPLPQTSNPPQQLPQALNQPQQLRSRGAGSVAFVPRPRPPKSTTQTQDPSLAQPQSVGVPRRPMSTLTGAQAQASARQAAASRLNTRRDGDAVESDSEDDFDDQLHDRRSKSTARKSAARSGRRPQLTPSQSSENDDSDGSATHDGARRGGSVWPNIKRISTPWNLMKLLLVVLSILPVLGFLSSGNLGQLISPQPVLSEEQFRRLNDFLGDPSNLTSSAKENLKSILPRMIHVQRDRTGKLFIDKEFWAAIKDRIQEDDSIFTLDGKSKIPERHWKALREQLNLGSGRPTTESWETWMRKNEQKIIRLVGDNLDGIIGRKLPSNVVTREEFVRELGKELSEQKTAMAGQLGDIKSALKSTLEDIKKLKSTSSTPRGMTEAEVSMLVDKVVSRAISRAQLESAAKGKIGRSGGSELDGRVNYFSPGNGALIDVSLTSPTIVIRKPRIASWDFFQLPKFRSSQFMKEAYAALTPWQDAGNCWCAAIFGKQGQFPADIAVQLADFVIPQYIVLEHISPDATADPKSMPRGIEIWAAIIDTHRERVKDWAAVTFPVTYGGEQPVDLHTEHIKKIGLVKIGEFQYSYKAEEDGVHVHRLSQELVSSLQAATDTVLVRAVTNYGADHTCFYRVRMYGEPYTGLDMGDGAVEEEEGGSTPSQSSGWW